MPYSAPRASVGVAIAPSCAHVTAFGAGAAGLGASKLSSHIRRRASGWASNVPGPRLLTSSNQSLALRSASSPASARTRSFSARHQARAASPSGSPSSSHGTLGSMIVRLRMRPGSRSVARSAIAVEKPTRWTGPAASRRMTATRSVVCASAESSPSPATGRLHGTGGCRQRTGSARRMPPAGVPNIGDPSYLRARTRQGLRCPAPGIRDRHRSRERASRVSSRVRCPSGGRNLDRDRN